MLDNLCPRAGDVDKTVGPIGSNFAGGIGFKATKPCAAFLYQHPVHQIGEIRVAKLRISRTGDTNEKGAPAVHSQKTHELILDGRNAAMQTASIWQVAALAIKHIICLRRASVADSVGGLEW